LIDWIDAKCRTWGYAKRRINGVPDQIPAAKRHSGELRTERQDKTTPAGKVNSIMGRIKEEGAVGASIYTGPAQPIEVLLGDALTVAVSINFAIQAGDLTDKEYEIGYIHYVLRGPAQRKWQRLNMKRADYYEFIHDFHKVLERWIPSVEIRAEKLKEVI
jgi:hypothetical protein